MGKEDQDDESEDVVENKPWDYHGAITLTGPDHQATEDPVPRPLAQKKPRSSLGYATKGLPATGTAPASSNVGDECDPTAEIPAPKKPAPRKRKKRADDGAGPSSDPPPPPPKKRQRARAKGKGPAGAPVESEEEARHKRLCNALDRQALSLGIDPSEIVQPAFTPRAVPNEGEIFATRQTPGLFEPTRFDSAMLGVFATKLVNCASGSEPVSDEERKIFRNITGLIDLIQKMDG